jgi:hypothetical protein
MFLRRNGTVNGVLQNAVYSPLLLEIFNNFTLDFV